MLQIIEVKTKKQRKEFVEYPLRLYKNNPYFVPPLYGDEMSMFTEKNVYFKTCESVFYLAQRDGKTVGRIQGIIQKQYNELNDVKQVRFSRFDAENNEYYCLRCGYHGDEEDVLRLNEQAKFKYKMMKKRVTSFNEDNAPLIYEDYKK